MAELTRKPARSDAAPVSARGAAFEARVRLTARSGAVLALPGQTCERVPEASLVWLAEQGLIIPRN